jgi:hypothetical protein
VLVVAAAVQAPAENCGSSWVDAHLPVWLALHRIRSRMVHSCSNIHNSSRKEHTVVACRRGQYRCGIYRCKVERPQHQQADWQR